MRRCGVRRGIASARTHGRPTGPRATCREAGQCDVRAGGGGAHLDGQLDRRVVARLEVEERPLVRAAPVAAVEDRALLHVERRRDELAVRSPG